MRIVILGGAGTIGRVIALDLVQDVPEVVIADRDLEAASTMARRVGKGAIAAGVDVTDGKALRSLLQGADACINSVNYYFNLDEISKPAMVFRGGSFFEMPPVSEEEYYLFPEPIGWAKTHLSLHSEVATIPLSLADKGIQECFFKITFFGYSEMALRKLQFLAEAGLADSGPIEVDGSTVRPRQVLLKLLEKVPQTSQKPVSKGFKDVATEVKGTKDCKPVTLRADTTGWPHPEWGVSGGTLLVGVPPAVLARWMADGRLTRPGVWAPEQVVDPIPFLDELALRGFTTTLTRTETVASP